MRWCFVTDHSSFCKLDYPKMATFDEQSCIDGRNFRDREDLQRANFYYAGVGADKRGSGELFSRVGSPPC